MSNAIRVCVVLGLVLVAAGSASAPSRHAVRKADTIGASYGATWSALIELFAERSWTIANMEKDSGLITTDWMSIDSDTPYADCGGAGLASVRGTQIRFNVLVKDLEATARVVVNTSFRQRRMFDGKEFMADCTSKGGVEQLILGEVADRAKRNARPHAAKTAPEAASTSRLYCTAAPADPTLAACARSAAGCAKRQADIIAAVGDATPCAEHAGALCFRATGAGGTITESCHPSAEACAKRLDQVRADAAFTDVTTCEALE